MTAASEPLLDEYGRYCAHFLAGGTAERVEEWIRSTGQVDYETEESERGFWRRIAERISSRKPLSMLRLGDGEGNLLFWSAHRDTFPQLAARSVELIWFGMFGRLPLAGEAEDTAEKMRQATARADALGIPWRDDIRYALEAAGDPELTESLLRGYAGYVAVWEQLAKGSPPGAAQLGTRRIHVAFLDAAAEVLAAAGNVSLVTCYPSLLDFVAAEFGVDGIESIVIPPQGESGESQWQLEVSSELRSRDLAGRLFLIGAGPAGKGLCDDVKRSGGMAIDLGSMLDVWAGVGTRDYQTPEFVRTYALRPT